MRIRCDSFRKTREPAGSAAALVAVALIGAMPPGSAVATAPSELPVNTEALRDTCTEISYFWINNDLTDADLAAAIHGGPDGLEFDFSGIDTLLDGTAIDPAGIYGQAYAGPYPFEEKEAGYAYRRFRISARIEEGQGTLRVGRLLRSRANSEGWTVGGRICIRFDLFLSADGPDRRLGVYDTFARFVEKDGTYLLRPTLVEGPFVGMIRSDDPTGAVIAFRSNADVEAEVRLGDGRIFPSDRPGRRHAVALDGLEPAMTYRYAVLLDDEEDARGEFRTAPPKGEGEVVFAYTGDSRSGYGGGPNDYMGVNRQTLDLLMAAAWREGAEFLIMGGDLVNGYTSSPADFASQLRAWKQWVSGFWRSKAIYPAVGNHEALFHVCEIDSGHQIWLDRWPYETESAEAVFADEFLNPKNAPAPSDPRRPPYEENVYSFQYGPVLLIAFNNNYWAAFGSLEFGGCPEGYILRDQIEWIGAQLDRAEADTTVSHVVLYAQEPVFPCGGHVGDAMWHGGDNNVRAATWEGDSLRAEAKGVIEVRNDLVRLIASHPKVAAVLGSDEHAYHRVLIGPEVPVGDPSRDDVDGDGRIGWPEESASPLADLPADKWYLVSGGAGAPYYSEEKSPWNEYWLSTPGREDRYRYSSQENILIFRADKDRISVRVLNRYREPIDEIDDLSGGR